VRKKIQNPAVQQQETSSRETSRGEAVREREERTEWQNERKENAESRQSRKRAVSAGKFQVRVETNETQKETTSRDQRGVT